MPELPEVESLRRVLAPLLTGRTVAAVNVRDEKAIARPCAELFCTRLRDKKITEVQRRGKFLTLAFADGSLLRVHMRMTGALLFVRGNESQPPEYTRVVFCLTDAAALYFCDQRRFGRMWLIEAGECDVYSGIGALGPEPFDASFNAEYLAALGGKTAAAIKSFLLNQKVVAGIGNIYADEILFAAGIDPRTPALYLTAAQWRILAALIPERLDFYTRKNTADEKDYLAGGGHYYPNTPYLLVYGRGGKKCRRCGGTLVKIKTGGRGSVYCPRCQSGVKEYNC